MGNPTIKCKQTKNNKQKTENMPCVLECQKQRIALQMVSAECFNQNIITRQFSMSHSQVNQSMADGPPDQDPIMASLISRPEPHWKPLECDQEEDEWSQAIKQS
ncbi:hypothetical protein P4O66_003837 [Electrophorus voltai]|uniref:Uncharacterized protein n=1 Tax=Electrophorus voltai TaxID=2609070 RepID=A0AAD8ZR43_9TELE|nr:hypothetical protein P4O66_003837 [Electrophorus voltai]